MQNGPNFRPSSFFARRIYEEDETFHDKVDEITLCSLSRSLVLLTSPVIIITIIAGITYDESIPRVPRWRLITGCDDTLSAARSSRRA